MDYYCASEESSSMVNRRLLASAEEQKQPVASESQRSLSRRAMEVLVKRCKWLLTAGTGDNRSYPWRSPLHPVCKRRVGSLVRDKEETKKKSNSSNNNNDNNNNNKKKKKKKNRNGIHVGHRQLHLFRLLPSTRQSETVVPPGHIAVSVGPERARFLFPVAFVNSPLFQSLLAQSKEAFGYHHHGAISLPCHVADFQDALTHLSLSSSSSTSNSKAYGYSARRCPKQKSA